MKGRRKYIVLAVILFFVGVVASGLFFVQPLLPSSAYVTTATLDGAPTRAELLSPLALSGLYYVHLPDVQPPPLYPWRRYRYLGIAFSRQSVFRGPIYGSDGFPFIHTDQAGGIRLNDPKIEDHWSVAFTADGVQFSNSSLSVSLHRRP